jgi:DNA-binding NarL/FixJ family response regulator
MLQLANARLRAHYFHSFSRDAPWVHPRALPQARKFLRRFPLSATRIFERFYRYCWVLPVDTLAVFDPEPVAMEGLRCLMESIDGPRVVAVESNVEAAVTSVRELQPSLLIVDKGLGVTNFTDWMRLLSVAEKPTAVIVWGTLMSQSEAVRFLQAGASGVIRKTAPLEEIANCVRAVAAGLNNWTESDAARDPRLPSRTARSSLTPREVQVMDLVEHGLKNKEIAEALGIRTGTVKIHLKHIFEKTGIRGRYGLVLSGLKHKGLLAAVV